MTTLDQFWEKYADEPYELIHGKIVEVKPKGELAQAVIEALGEELEEFVDWQDNEDVLAGSVACKLADDTLLAGDITLFKEEKIAQVSDPESYVPFAPDFVAEVAGDQQTEDEMQERIKLYLAAGAKLIWIAYPARKEVVVYYPGGSSRTITGDQNIGGSDVMPGLEITPNEIFNA